MSVCMLPRVLVKQKSTLKCRVRETIIMPAYSGEMAYEHRSVPEARRGRRPCRRKHIGYRSCSPEFLSCLTGLLLLRLAGPRPMSRSARCRETSQSLFPDVSHVFYCILKSCNADFGISNPCLKCQYRGTTTSKSWYSSVRYVCRPIDSQQPNFR